MAGSQPTLKPGDSDLDSLVKGEIVESMATTQSLALVINLLLAATVAVALYSEHRDARLALWFTALAIINAARWTTLCSKTFRRLAKAGPSTTLRLGVAGAFVSGCAWGLVPVVFLDFTGVASPFACIILFGLTAGAAVQGRAYAPPVVALATPVLLPLILKLAQAGGPCGGIFAFDTFLYLWMILRSCREGEATFANHARLRWQAGALAADLAVQHAEAQAAADRYHRLANHDPLTGAANRGAFARELESRLRDAGPLRPSLALMLLDLDHFKSINDTLGHGAGDEVLHEIVARLQGLRDGAYFVARLGGDEFAVLLETDREAAELPANLDALLRRLGEPMLIGGQSLEVGTSIGVACHPADAVTRDEMMSRADLALYAAKDAGRSAWRRFEPTLLARAERARDIERDLPPAIAAETIEVWFQPQVEIAGERLVGLEALLRWRHPQHGWIAPPDVVATAFKLRRSEFLTRHVLNQACAMLGRLSALALEDVRIGVNISPREIVQYDLLGMVKAVVAAHGVDPRRLELEITEEAMLVDPDAIATLAALRAFGVQLAVDDFGTGNSSLAYLRRLSIDRIKIDRIFVEGLPRREGDRIVVKGVLIMARSLGIEVIAEGVEHAEEALALSSLGCNHAQGYLYGAALSPVQAGERLRLEIERRGGASPVSSSDGPQGTSRRRVAHA